VNLLTATQMHGPGDVFQCVEGEPVIWTPCAHPAGDLDCCRAFVALSAESPHEVSAFTSTAMIRDLTTTMSDHTEAIAAFLVRMGNDPASVAITAPQIAGAMRFAYRGTQPGTVIERRGPDEWVRRPAGST
jgi:hypothetical protein